MNLADLFAADPWGEFDALSLPRQALEVYYMKKQYESYRERHQKNSGILGAPDQKISEDTIAFIVNEIEKIQSTHVAEGKKGSLNQAYISLVEKVLSDPETERIFIENKWLISYKSSREKEIHRIAKQFQQAGYRYRNKK